MANTENTDKCVSTMKYYRKHPEGGYVEIKKDIDGLWKDVKDIECLNSLRGNTSCLQRVPEEGT